MKKSMKNIIRGVSAFIFLVVFLASCSSREQGGIDDSAYEYQRDLLQSRDELISTVAFIKDSMIYQTIGNGETSYYSLDIPNDELIELGTVSDFVMDTGASVLFDDDIYFYVTVDDGDTKKNVLYFTDSDGSEIVKLSEDSDCSPLLSLYSVPQGVLALKLSDSRSWFELVVSENGACDDVILEAASNETFVIADVAGDYLFVLTYRNNNFSEEGYEYYIRKYLIKDFSEAEVISLQPIAAYMSESRIGTMKIIGNYVFFENYSNIGTLCEIFGETVEKIIQEEDFVYADGLANNADTYDIFYTRRTNEAYLFDHTAGEILPFTLALPDDYSIQIIFSGEDCILVKAKKYDISNRETACEKIYLYDYSAFVEMASTANE